MQSFKNILVFLFGISIGALIWGISLIFLQKTPIFYVKDFKEYSFYPINLTRLFFNKTPILKSEINNKKNIYLLKGIKLKALFFDGKNGFIIIEDNNKNYFINLYERYKGYLLTKISQNYAIFKKGNKIYKISMEKEIKNSFTYTNSNSNNAPKIIHISKETFNSYKNNLTKIWKNIGIIKNSEGYKITYINPNSIFARIGLQKGDILLEVNGRKLKNDADAWDLYKNADKFNEFEIKIKRNNQIKVINYEMD